MKWRLANIFVMSIATMALAQAQGNAELAGCVSDTMAQRLPGATVVATGGGVRRTTEADTSGCYELKGLPSGSYRVTTRLPAFDNLTHDDVHVAAATVTAAQAAIGDAEAARDAADASVSQLQAMLDDMTLVAPASGRVEYKLVQAGEVLSAGASVVSLLDLTDVTMTIFLPTADAGRVGLGSEARIVLDAAPDYVVPAAVSFVAAEAQFTPKFVETENEREKLMYRIKLKIDPKLLQTYRDYVKAGLTGDAYVKVQADAPWPDALAPKLPPAPGNAAQ